MNKVTRACLIVVALLALVGLAAAGSHGRRHFNLADVDGRYVSAETAYDISQGNALPAVLFAGASVMIADGQGHVCGESDGFYGGNPPPGLNLGPSLFHGTYTVEATTGRITIITASDGPPVPLTNVFCGTTAPIDTTGAVVFKTQVGYLQSDGGDGAGNKIVTTEQINASDASQGGCCATSGFLVHARVWTKAGERESEHERDRD